MLTLRQKSRQSRPQLRDGVGCENCYLLKNGMLINIILEFQLITFSGIGLLVDR